MIFSIKIIIPPFLFVFIGILLGCNSGHSETHQGDQTAEIYSGNPILPGDFADPCIIQYRDTFYIYATSGNEATVWRSVDFVNWKLTKLNWPTEMNLPNIWAPAVTEGLDGRFYFYPSVDHNIYAGVADHPLGPFTNLLSGDSIFIENRKWWDKMHSIDADCFIDNDGQAYLYWGSGFDFKDGICAVGKLDSSMANFQEEPILVTPHRYFEGPHMLKKDSLYYLMYSDSLYYDSTYKVRYAVSTSPMGPFTEGKNSPILKSTSDGSISGPGHHFTIMIGDEYFIVYHRHTIPYYKPYGNPIRQICIDRLRFDAEGNVETVKATQEGVALYFIERENIQWPISPISMHASSENGDNYVAEAAFDNDYGTIWAAPNEGEVWLEADLGKAMDISAIEPIFDQPMGNYDYLISLSANGESWTDYAAGNNSEAKEWPVKIQKNASARYIKITMSDPDKSKPRLGLWEFKIWP